MGGERGSGTFGGKAIGDITPEFFNREESGLSDYEKVQNLYKDDEGYMRRLSRTLDQRERDFKRKKSSERIQGNTRYFG